MKDYERLLEHLEIMGIAEEEWEDYSPVKLIRQYATRRTHLLQMSDSDEEGHDMAEALELEMQLNFANDYLKRMLSQGGSRIISKEKKMRKVSDFIPTINKDKIRRVRLSDKIKANLPAFPENCIESSAWDPNYFSKRLIKENLDLIILPENMEYQSYFYTDDISILEVCVIDAETMQ